MTLPGLVPLSRAFRATLPRLELAGMLGSAGSVEVILRTEIHAAYRMRSVVRLACAGFLALAGCGRSSEPDTLEIQPLPCPAPHGSAEPNLHSSGDRLYLSWLVHRDSIDTFQYASYQHGNWSEPRTIAEGNRFFANWADVPSLARLNDGSLLAHWLQKSGADKYAYDVMIAHSEGGTDWQAAFRPHRDGTQTEHGFVSLVPDADSGAIAVWLDGRGYAGKEHDEGETQLMWTRVGPEGATPETPLDTRVCDCCPTTAVRTAAGILVAYRNRSPEEVRDIYLVRHESGSWSEPYALSDDGWRIAGCPVNGPALAADGDHVVAAWFTIPDKQPEVRVAFSDDGGRRFSTFVRVDDGEPLGRVDAVLLPSGNALVVWLESPAEGPTEVRARQISPDGRLENSFVVAATSADRASGFPRLVRLGETLYFAWTHIAAEGDDESQVRMMRLRVPDSGH